MIGDYCIEIKGDREAALAMERMAQSVEPNRLWAMQEAAKETVAIMKDLVPVRTGSLASSIDYDLRLTGDDVTAEIGPNDAYWGRPVGRAVELGRLPKTGHFPNWFDIAVRYGLSTAVAYKAAKTIFERGTLPGLRFVQKTLEIIKAPFLEIGIAAAEKIAGEWTKY
jgi:hypothetical protein